MRVWPLEVALQEQASNRLKLLSLATRRAIWGLSAEGCADRSGAESFWPQVKGCTIPAITIVNEKTQWTRFQATLDDLPLCPLACPVTCGSGSL